MTVEIDDGFGDFIRRKIEAGNGRTIAEVLEMALNRWAVDELEFAPGELDALLKPALEQLDRGEVLSADEVDRRLEEHKRQFKAGRIGA